MLPVATCNISERRIADVCILIPSTSNPNPRIPGPSRYPSQSQLHSSSSSSSSRIDGGAVIGENASAAEDRNGEKSVGVAGVEICELLKSSVYRELDEDTDCEVLMSLSKLILMAIEGLASYAGSKGCNWGIPRRSASRLGLWEIE